MQEKDYYSIKAISASSLKWFEVSPLYFKQMLDKEIEQEEKSYFELGKQVHMKLLEPDKFNSSYICLEFNKPKSEQQLKFCEDFVTSKLKSVEERAVEAYKNNYSADKLKEDAIIDKALELKKTLHQYIQYLKKRSEVRDVLNKYTWNYIHEAEASVHSHIKANELLVDIKDPLKNIEYLNEFEILWEFYNLPCKSAIDRLIIDRDNKIIKLVDLKTTSNLPEFSDRFTELKYNRQLAFYWLAIAYYFKNIIKEDIDLYTKESYIVAIQSKNPYGVYPTESKVFPVKDASLNNGLDSIENVFSDLKWHWDNNQWEHTKSYYVNNGLEEAL